MDVLHGKVGGREKFKHVEEHGHAGGSVLLEVVGDVAEEACAKLYCCLLEIFELSGRVDGVYERLLVRVFVSKDLCADPFVVAGADRNRNLERARRER